ncbi:hypothetical protein BFW01_g4957 [Lasiodiplodia theobromae]|uniref:Uncharacterized protein n=1 Tax=Lasiodiplodia theobromae TaxID=45133 RepID=A0A5N5D6B6_9PEZI|nr:uncharacterized protein LTHEOB_6166 [Lasiodiplodia theobromae]KAB2573151.1 hypothetical protein DBV05_g8202 [Lasiodiplodia theobromae]KAF4544596.1 hypothetical protein LTHEOB_6166 [Lasiodiplodia theobromae]KAF9634062.1 hypothetical protein BFW01_g4957 [Lasiodiplodia theobromae]
MAIDGNVTAIALILSILFSTYCSTLIYGIVEERRLRHANHRDVEVANNNNNPIPRPIAARLGPTIELNNNLPTSSPILRSANGILHHPSPVYPARLQRARVRFEACTDSCCQDPFELESAMPAPPPPAVSPSSIYGDDDSVSVAPDDAFSVGSDDEEEDGLHGMEAVELDDPLSEIMEKEVFPGGCI